MLDVFFEHSFTCFGIFFNGSNGRKAAHKPYHVFCWMGVVTVVDAFILLYIIYEYFINIDDNLSLKNSPIQLYSNISESICAMIFYTVCASRAIIIQKKVFQILALLKKVKRSLPIRKLKLVKKNQAIFVIVFYTLWIFLSLLEISIRVKNYGTFQFILVFKHYAQIYLSLCAFTFVLLVIPLYRLFQALNNKLNNILKQNNNKRKTDGLSPFGRESTLDMLSNCHWDLSEAMYKLDEAFGFQLLLIIFYVYIKCITNLYKFIASAYFLQTEVRQHNFFLVYFGWMILYFSIAVVVFKACSDTTVEATKTNVIIWDNIEHQSLPLAEKLNTFSTTLNHSNYKFTACGFFVLELSTLSTMVLSITTQLVILFSIFRDS